MCDLHKIICSKDRSKVQQAEPSPENDIAAPPAPPEVPVFQPTFVFVLEVSTEVSELDRVSQREAVSDNSKEHPAG